MEKTINEEENGRPLESLDCYVYNGYSAIGQAEHQW